LDPENSNEWQKSELAQRFGLIIRKIWYGKNYKDHVSPHEFLQEVAIRSDKKYKIGTLNNPLSFLAWFINTLHVDLGDNDETIINRCFRGKVRFTVEKPVRVKKMIDGKKVEMKALKKKKVSKTKEVSFLILKLDIPPPPLFKEDPEKSVIPQEPLFTLLAKYDGITKQYDPTKNENRSYQIVKLPKYLILHINRFTKNQWYIEKNPTIVNFPLKNLDMKSYTDYPEDSNLPTKYNLIANIRHNGKPEEGTYNLHLHEKSNLKWYDIQDLFVEEVLPPLIALSEAYIQIYELVED